MFKNRSFHAVSGETMTEAKSEGVIGEIITLLNNAAILAIESGEERINKKILARIDYLSPTERRRVSERDLIQ